MTRAAVVQFRPRRAPDADQVEACRRIVAAVQAIGGREQAVRELAERIGLKVWPSTVGAWETEVPPPSDVLAALEAAAAGVVAEVVPLRGRRAAGGAR